MTIFIIIIIIIILIIINFTIPIIIFVIVFVVVPLIVIAIVQAIAKENLNCLDILRPNWDLLQKMQLWAFFLLHNYQFNS